MPDETHDTKRRGVVHTLTMDPDASELLRELTPSKKAHGRFLSELLRAEKSRREERQRVREELRLALTEVTRV